MPRDAYDLKIIRVQAHLEHVDAPGSEVDPHNAD